MNLKTNVQLYRQISGESYILVCKIALKKKTILHGKGKTANLFKKTLFFL
jgi:hypothetical protein